MLLLCMPIPLILHVVIAKPVRHCFDYYAPEGVTAALPGTRVLVPFGKQHLIGIIISADHTPCISSQKLRRAIRIIDSEPLLNERLLALYHWTSRYYQHPLGDIILGNLPQQLKHVEKGTDSYRLTAAGQTVDITTWTRQPKQRALLQLLRTAPQQQLTAAELTTHSNSAMLRKLLQQGWLERIKTNAALPDYHIPQPDSSPPEPALTLNANQQQALTQLTRGGFAVFLLEGITGSGKTEVYLQAIAHYLHIGKQALVLVPEIGLTPQTIARFARRFRVPIATWHSGLSERERTAAWLGAHSGAVRIVIGTRSALFIPLAQPGIIIIDEEHDASFKQQSGLRYSARDLAIVRGRLENIPVVLGSATPALESLHNATTGRFTRLCLPERAGTAIQPSFHLIDIRNQPLSHGLSPQLLTAIDQHLAQNNQVLLFLNRRGYAPLLLCHHCGWSALCTRCDAKLTLHRAPLRLICHHCNTQAPLPSVCGSCQSTALLYLGLGTERLEDVLGQHFPGIPLVRIDRDTVRQRGAMEQLLEHVHQGHKQILLGTQMITKGHHFPNVTLVGIIDADWGLYSSDFRATERMGQLLLQVAGRAGRADKPGQVYIQTHVPHHPLLQALIQHGYGTFAEHVLAERRISDWPPFSFLALLRAEATTSQAPFDFLTQAQRLGNTYAHGNVQLLGPVPAPMARKAGHFRALLLCQTTQRKWLQQWLTQLIPELERLKSAKKVRWSLDVDPVELY